MQIEVDLVRKPKGGTNRLGLVAALLFLSWLLGYTWVYAQISGTVKECPMRFAVVGDRTGGHQPGVYEQIIKEVQRLKPDFVLTVGDMIEGYSNDTIEIKRQREEYKGIIKPLTMPIYFTPGNHDITDSTYLELYKRQIGEPYYSFDIRGAHFIVLDNSRFDSTSAFPKGQMDWLVSDLEKNKNAIYTFVFFHKPFWIETIADGKSDTLHSLFVKYGVDAVFTGHYHYYFSGNFDGILYTSVGSSGADCSPGPTGLQYHFTLVTVDKDGISIAPVKIGGVLPWDEVTAKEFRLLDKMEREAIQIGKASFGSELVLPETHIKVNIKNLNDQITLIDTLRWEIPTSWSVAPQVLSIEIKPLESYAADFVVKSSGSIYPTPTLSVQFPYAQNKKKEMKTTLGVSRTAHAYKAGKPPLIDGDLDENVWKEPITYLFAQDGSAMTIEPVSFYFAWDKDNLYLAAKCTETKMDSIAARATKHDGAVYAEDCVGYFIQPNTEDGPVYQIYLNPLGKPFDQKITVKNGIGVAADREWNGQYQVKAFKGKDYWTIEAKIPLRQLGVKAQTGKSWGIGFRRKQRRLSSAADWLVPTSYDSKDYGILLLK